MTFVCIWERMLDTLDTSGGHIALLFVLLIVGVGMMVWHVPKGEDVMAAALGAILLSLKTAHSNHTRHQGAGTPPSA